MLNSRLNSRIFIFSFAILFSIPGLSYAVEIYPENTSGKSDPELYFDDLSIRNLNFGTPGAGVPEPTSLALLGLGLIGLIFKRRN